jgi:hypothetical protein
MTAPRPISTSVTTSASPASIGPQGRQRHHGAHLFDGDRQRTARRLSGRDRPGDSARHRRHQGVRARPTRTTRISCSAKIGGTVGDIESLPFLEAIRQLGNELGRERTPLRAPHAGALYRGRGRAEDEADAALGQGAALHRYPAGHLLCRCGPIPAEEKRKIALFCNVRPSAVIEARDVEHDL